MRYTKAFLLIAILYSTGCKSPTESAQSQDPFSLQKAWIYSNQTFGPNGPIGATTTDSEYVVSSTKDKGKTNYSLNNNNVFIVDSNGLMTGYDQTGCLCETYKIPGITGDTVLRRDSIPTKINGNVEFGTIIIFEKNDDTTITVPAGTFRCAVFEIEIFINGIPSGAPGFSYISPSVGVVETDSYSIDTATSKVFLYTRKQLIRTIK